MMNRLTLGELAKHLKLGEPTLYQLAREGGIPAHKFGRVWRFDVEELDKWMKSDGQYESSRRGKVAKKRQNR